MKLMCATCTMLLLVAPLIMFAIAFGAVVLTLACAAIAKFVWRRTEWLG